MKNKALLRTFGVIGGVVLLVVVLLSIFRVYTVVNPGQRGILLQLGEVRAVFEPGLHFQWPVINNVVLVDVRTQKVEDSVNAASKDLQLIDGTIALNYHISPGEVDQLYERVGLMYQDRIISPAIQESVKAATAKYTAEALITERPKVKLDILSELESRLANYAIVVEDVSIVNFDFSDEFNAEIEAKQTAQQRALKAENDLRRIEIEAQQTIEAARAEAESIRIQGEALRENQDLVRLKMVEKWDGRLPVYSFNGSGAAPLIQLPNLN